MTSLAEILRELASDPEKLARALCAFADALERDEQVAAAPADPLPPMTRRGRRAAKPDQLRRVSARLRRDGNV